MEKILIAEDERIVALELSLALQKMGYNILGNVARGQDLIDKAFIGIPDIIITDIHLKDNISGLTAINEIRTQLNPVIIVITGYYDKETIDAVHGVRPHALLHKPFNPALIKEIIDSARKN